MSNFVDYDNMTDICTATGTKIVERAKIFPGTKAEWDALPLSEKVKYDYVAFAGDSQSGVVDDVPTKDSENLVKSGGVYNSLSNRNLLDNPWFTVNQRGDSSYIQGRTSYFADRWKRYVPELTFTNNNGVNISGTPSSIENLGKQNIEWDRLKDFIGKSITLSVLIDGTVYKAVGKIETPTSSWESHVSLQIPSLNIWFQLLTYGTAPSLAELYIKNINTDAMNVTIRAVKLELGSVSTLAMDTAPNMALELAKCQRYFQRLVIKESTDYNAHLSITYGIAHSTTQCWAPFYLESSMRAVPTLSIIGDVAITPSTYSQRVATTVDNTLTVDLVTSNSKGNFVNLQWTLSTELLTTGTLYKLVGVTGKDPIYFDFDAEL